MRQLFLCLTRYPLLLEVYIDHRSVSLSPFARGSYYFLLTSSHRHHTHPASSPLISTSSLFRSVVQQTPLQTTKPVTEETFGFGKSSAVVGKTTARAVAESMTSSQLMTSSNTRSDVITPAQVRSTSTCSNTVTGIAASDMDPEETPAFIKAFIFSPEVPIRVDYKGKNVRGDKNLISNPVTNLLIGLAQLNCSELRLR